MADSFEYILFGDVEAMVVKILTDHTAMQALSIDGITTDLIGYEQGMKWIEILVQGGSYRYKLQKRPRIDVICYGPSRSVTYDMATTAQAVLMSMQGQNYAAFGVKFIAVQVETDLFRSTETDTNTIRYIQALRFIIIPAVTSP